MGILEQARGGRRWLPECTVGGSVTLPATDTPRGEGVVTKPDGNQVPLAKEVQQFAELDVPGVYELAFADQSYKFAVNTDPAESVTGPMDVQQLEQFGVQLGAQRTQSEEIERERHLRDVELESRQKLWRWLILGAFGVLIVETWLAGKKSRIITRSDGDTE